ncbi:hypothetical protein D3C86_1361680 [compost metagenome]
MAGRAGVLSDAQQDHAVSALRYAMLLGLDHEVAGFERVAVALLDEGADFVLKPR